MLYKSNSSGVFAATPKIKDNVQLKDSRPIREAFIRQELSRLPANKLQQFVKSPEAKTLMEMEMISPDTVEFLSKQTYNDRSAELMVCHMAQENEDERWNELVALRAKERALMKSLISDYYNKSEEECKRYRDDVINKYVPKEYRTSE